MPIAVNLTTAYDLVPVMLARNQRLSVILVSRVINVFGKELPVYMTFKSNTDDILELVVQQKKEMRLFLIPTFLLNCLILR